MVPCVYACLVCLVCVGVCMCVYMSMYSMYEPVLWYQQLVSSLYVSSAGSVCGLHRWIKMDLYLILSKSNILKSMSVAEIFQWRNQLIMLNVLMYCSVNIAGVDSVYSFL